MKVAIVVRSLKIGGMERVAISLTKAFQDAGHESHLIYFKKKKEEYSIDPSLRIHHLDFDKILVKSGVGIFYGIFARILNIFFRQSYFVWIGLITSLIFKKKLAKLEKDGKTFDLVIIRGQGTFEYLWYKQDNRYVQVCENILFPDHTMSFLRKIYINLLYSNKNIACVSNGVLESFHALEAKADFKAKKSLKITNPIDIQTIQQSIKAYTPTIDTPYIVNVGRIAPVKQLSLLIDAYAYMKHKYHFPHKLVLVGKGHDEDNINKKIRDLNLENSVIMAGLQTNPYPWIANADLFVLSSKHEGLGMVLLEALACHTNLIATKSIGGVKDIMQNELENLLCAQEVEVLGDKIAEQLTTPYPIMFEKHIEPFLPLTIVTEYLNNFVENE